MNITDIKIGTKLELAVCDYNGKALEPKFVSQLEEIIDNYNIIIAAPIHEGEIVPISIGVTVRIVFLDEKGLFAFKATVRKRGKKSNIQVLEVEVISHLTKIQRREFFRLNWVMPVKIRIVKTGENTGVESIQDPIFTEALSKDLSGGGVGIVSDIPHQLNDIVEIELILENQNIILVLGKIVRSQRMEHYSNSYDIGIIFTDITSRDRDAIIKFIFEKQAELKRKGLL